MREILFRGKSYTDNKWHYGYYMLRPATAFSEERHEITDGAGLGWNCPAETIGQYTGWVDKGEKKIFEGDIIKLVNADYEEITITCEFGTCRRQIFENEVEITGFYYIRSDDGRKTFPITHNYLGKHDTEIWEVVGNIHDAIK